MINKAIMFATLAHEKQKRKGTEIPYIMHPLEAGVIASQIKFDENIICAAILHDVVEDAKVKHETIVEMFNKRVSELVMSQSEDKSKTWKERKQHTVEFLKQVEDEDIKIISLADKLANIRAMYRDYITEGDKLWERFNEKDKSEQGKYYMGLIEGLSSLCDNSFYQEYKNLVGKIFG